MARIELRIEADSLDDLTSIMGSMSGTGTEKTTRRRRTNSGGDEGAVEPTNTAAPSSPVEDPDLGPSTPSQPATPSTPEEFITEVKKLLGKGKDDAVRNRLKALGYEAVRAVPANRYTEILAELAKV